MSGDSLVVAPQDSGGDLTGLGAVETLVATGNAVAGGDWVEAGVMGVASGLEGLGAVDDPGAALVAAGVGWVLEHFDPLTSWLDELAGDPDQIHAFASTWHNIADRVHGTSDEFLDAVGRATSSWDGLAVEGYRAAAHAQAAVIDGFGAMVTGVAGAVETAGAIVAGVREIVRDAIGQLVGRVLSCAAQLATGVLAAKAIGEIVAAVAEWAARISGFVKGLVTSMGNLGGRLDELLGAALEAGSAIRVLSDRWAATSVANGHYDVDRILAGTARPGNGLPTLANITYQETSGGIKHLTGLDDRPS
jgi:hypothetical protein